MKQVNWTCPDIDKLQKTCKTTAKEIISLASYMEEGENVDQLKSLAYDIENIVDELEDLRSSNSDLRDNWIEADNDRATFEENCSKLEEENQSMKDYIKELEDKIKI